MFELLTLKLDILIAMSIASVRFPTTKKKTIVLIEYDIATANWV